MRNVFAIAFTNSTQCMSDYTPNRTDAVKRKQTSVMIYENQPSYTCAGDSNPRFGSTNVGKERVSAGRFFTVPTAVPISLKKR